MRQLKITSKITSRESRALEQYLNDIGKIELLSLEEEAALARKIIEGDQDALEQLCNANLRFVVSVAKQYQNQGLSLSDLINEGNVGLLKAARRFDETKGFKFISYAVWWIRQSILQAIVENSRMVRIPVSKSGSYYKVTNAYTSFVQEFEREPTDEELAEVLLVTPKEVRNMRRSQMRHNSLDVPLGNEEGSATLLDNIPDSDGSSPDDALMEQSLREEVRAGMSFLSPREKDVLVAYFGLSGQQPLNLEEIGEMLDLTRERVRQIKERAIRRLRKTINRNDFRYYL